MEIRGQKFGSDGGCSIGDWNDGNDGTGQWDLQLPLRLNRDGCGYIAGLS
jgi:hypothetical protein